MVRDDGDKAKTGIRRILSRGVRVRRNGNAAVVTPKTRPRHLYFVRIKVYESDVKAVLDSRAIRNLITKRLYSHLLLEVERRPESLVVAEGQ